MEKDFTFTVYEDLIREILKTGRQLFPLEDYFTRREGAPAFFILRHDVDRRPLNALRMAALEHAFGVRATYYFRIRRNAFNGDVIRKIAALGHEIGYHYEVMDKARGDLGRAERIFEDELGRLRALADIRTASMHGNPLSSRDNREFWKHFSLSQFDLLGEAYVSVSDPDLYYVTDTGRGWNRGRYNVQDRFPGDGVQSLPSCSGTEGLIRIIRGGRFKRIYLQVHPNRWSWGRVQWYRQWGEDLCLNAVKSFLNLSFRRNRAQ